MLGAERVPRLPRERVGAAASWRVALLAGYAALGRRAGAAAPRRLGRAGRRARRRRCRRSATVQMPYVSADPWPRIVLELLGAELLILAGLLTFWPRVPSAPDVARALRAAGARLSVRRARRAARRRRLAGRVARRHPPARARRSRSPRSRSASCGSSGCRSGPGWGSPRCSAIALAGALPLAAVADRGEPWFDYRSFAESLGPDDPVRFSWAQSYGPITWPRDGNEVMRITSSRPPYWKARNLDDVRRLRLGRRGSDPTTGAATSRRPTSPRTGSNRPAWTRTIAVSVRRMRTHDVIGAGTTWTSTRRVAQRAPGRRAGTWDAPTGCAAATPTPPRSTCPKPTPRQLARPAEPATRAPGRPSGVITVPFRAGESAPTFEGAIERPDAAAPRPRSTSRPGTAAAEPFADVPDAQHSSGDIDTAHGALAVRAHVGSSPSGSSGHRGRRWTTSAPSTSYLHGRSSATPSARPSRPRPARARLLPQRDARGLLPALRRRDGAAAADGRDLRARGDRASRPAATPSASKAWIVRDTDAHAWVEVWFDELRLGHVRPDAGRDPGPLADRRARPLPSGAPLAPDRDPAPPATRATATRRRSASAPSCGSAVDEPRAAPRRAGEGGTAAGAWVGAARCSRSRSALGVLLFIRRPRRRRRRWTARSPSSRTRCAASGARSATGTTLPQLERRLGSHSPEAAAYLRALAAGRYAPRGPTRRRRAGRRALRRALARASASARAPRALWALPPRLERRAAPRTRTFEMETTVRG